MRQARLVDLKKMAATLFLLGLRASGLFSKFMLTIYIAKQMSLSDLGLYGLIAVGATIVPGLFGLGLNGPASRSIVSVDTHEAVRIASTRISVTLLLHLIISPLAVIGLILYLPHSQAGLVLLVAITLFMENIASDLNSVLLARFRSNMASILLFIRSGLWPLVYIGFAWYYPPLRTVETIIEFWLASLLLLFAIVGGMALKNSYWRWVSVDVPLARDMIRKGHNFYAADIGNSGILYLDRFLVSTFLGLEATGVYTFFWSITNAVNNLIFTAVTSPRAPKVISAVKLGQKNLIQLACKSMIKEIFLWCVGLSAILLGVMPYVIRFLNNDKFSAHKEVFFVMLLATGLRTVSEGADAVLYAHHQDRKIALISITTMGVSGACISMLAPWLGLFGVAVAMLLAAIFILAWRGRTARALVM